MSLELLSLAHPSDTLKDIIVPLASAALGAIAGAAASYVPARILAKRASDEVLRRDDAARRDHDLRAARQVFAKLAILVNSLCGVHKRLEEMIAKAERDGNSEMRIWQRLSTFPGIEREPQVEFTADELSLYVAAKRPDYVDDLILLARRHAANISNLAAFAKLKTDLHYELAGLGDTTWSGTTISTTRMHVPQSVANTIRLKGDELEIFATEMRSTVAENDRFARNVAGRFSEVTKAYLGDAAVLSFAPIEDEAQL